MGLSWGRGRKGLLGFWLRVPYYGLNTDPYVFRVERVWGVNPKVDCKKYPEAPK